MQEAEARGAKPQKQNSSLPEHIQQAASTERGMKLQHRDGAVQRKNAEKGGKGKGISSLSLAVGCLKEMAGPEAFLALLDWFNLC